MKKLLAVFAAVAVVFSGITVFAAELPADVQNCSEIHTINTLLQHGVIGLSEEGRFRPDHFITREHGAYFMAGLIRQIMPEANTWEHADSVSSYSDISADRWSAENIGLLLDLGYLPKENDFRPDDFLTRAEFADMIYSYMKNLPSFDNATYWFADVPAENLAVGYVCAKGVMYPKGDGLFHPTDYMTRAEACNALYAISGFELIYGSDNLPRKAVLNTPYVSQLSPVYAVVGCEGASLLMGLKAKGYASGVGLREFLDNMPKHSSNPAKGYVGSPYIATQYHLRTTIYPAPLAEYGRRYGKVSDFSGSSPRELQAELLSGNAVVVYSTMNWVAPRYVKYNIEGEIQSLLRNNHVILVDGYNRDTGEYHISDPYNNKNTSKEYKYWIDGETFEYCYNIRRHGVLIE